MLEANGSNKKTNFTLEFVQNYIYYIYIYFFFKCIIINKNGVALIGHSKLLTSTYTYKSQKKSLFFYFTTHFYVVWNITNNTRIYSLLGKFIDTRITIGKIDICCNRFVGDPNILLNILIKQH